MTTDNPASEWRERIAAFAMDRGRMADVSGDRIAAEGWWAAADAIRATLPLAPAPDVREAAQVHAAALLADLSGPVTVETIGRWHGAYEVGAAAFYHGPDDGAPPWWRAMRAFLAALAAQPQPEETPDAD